MIEQFSITSYNIKPHLLVIFLVFFAVYFPSADAVIASFAIGFLADLIGPAMGTYMLSYGVLGSVLVWLHRYLAIRRLTWQSVTIFLMAICVGLTAKFLTSFKGANVTSEVYSAIFASAVYSAIIGPFLFFPACWWMKIKQYNYGIH